MEQDKIMKYIELEKQYKDLFTGESSENLFPIIWNNINNLDLKIEILKDAISMKKTIVEIDSNNMLLKAELYKKIDHNFETTKNMALERMMKVRKERQERHIIVENENKAL